MRWIRLLLLILLLPKVCLSQGRDLLIQQQAEDYRRRVTWFIQADIAWMAEVTSLSPEQKIEVRRLADQMLEQEMRRFVISREDRVPLSRFADDTQHPVVFALESSPASGMISKLNVESWGQILTAAQQAALTEARTERIQSRREAFAIYAAVILDLEVYLTPEQREALFAGWRNETTRMDSGFFTCSHREDFSLPRQSLREYVLRIPGIVLREDQWALVNHAADPLLPQSVVIDSFLDSETQLENWKRQSLALRDLVLEYGEARIVYYSAAARLAPPQTDQLRSAAKGVATQMADEWLSSTVREAQLANAPGRRLAMANVVVGTQQFDQHPLWASSLQQVCGESLAQLEAERENRMQTAVASAVVAMLDQELWLTPQQRQKLLPLVQGCLPKQTLPLEEAHVPRAFVDMVYPLLKLPPEFLSPILADAQLGVWQEMKSRLEVIREGEELVLQIRENPVRGTIRYEVLLDTSAFPSLPAQK